MNADHNSAALWWHSVLVAFGVFATRIPFLFDGPGRDPDAWKIIITARRLALDGRYEVSRFPGNPLVELAMSPLATLPLWTYGALTAVVSALGAVLLHRFLARRTAQPALKAALIFMLPMILIESVTAMDHIWSLVFGIAGLCMVSRHVMVLAGVAFGLAIAARLTGCLFLPVAALVFLENRPDLRSILKSGLIVGAVAAVTSAVFFALPYSVYGWDFLRFYDVNYPTPWVVLFRATFAFGGLISTILATCLLFYSIVLQLRSPRTENRWLSYAALCGTGLFTLLFLRAPFESAYLIPSMVFLFLHAAIWVPTRQFQLVIGIVVISGFVDFSPAKVGLGTVIKTQIEKAAIQHRFIELSAILKSFSPNDVLIAGYLEPGVIAVETGRFASSNVKYTLNSNDAQQVLSNRGKIYYILELKEFIEGDSGIILQDISASPL